MITENERNEIIDDIIDEITLSAELKKLNNEDLVKRAINEFADYTWHPIVEEMMDRLSSGWEGNDDEKAEIYAGMEI